MNTISAFANFLFLIACWCTCVSCNGLNSSARVKAAEQIRRPGRTVTALDGGIMAVFQDGKGYYWFGSKDKGVYRYDGDSLLLFTTKDGLCSHSIIGIQEDQSGRIYFDTPKGVSQFDGQVFRTLTVTDDTTTQQAWKMEPDDLWFRMGWDGKGVYRFDGKSLYRLALPRISQIDSFYAKYPNSSYSPYGIYTIYKNQKGVLWFGTASLGVCRYDGNSFSWLYERQLTETPSGGDFGIRSIIEDKDGDYWICNTRYRYEILAEENSEKKDNYINYNKKDGIAAPNRGKEEMFPYFLSVAEDDNGDLWMVTYDNGVWQYDGEKLIHHLVGKKREKVFLFSIYKDAKGLLWLGTHNSGVYVYKGNVFEQFRP